MWWIFAAFAGSHWQTLQQQEVEVRCQVTKEFACIASAWLPAPPEVVEPLLADVASYPELFATVVAATAEGDRWRITLAPPMMPTVEASLSQKTTAGRHHFVATTELGSWEADVSVRAVAGGSQVSYSWKGSRWRGGAALQRRLLRAQGHNAIWGIALGAEVVPTVHPPHS